jgi:hypothetical protein
LNTAVVNNEIFYRGMEPQLQALLPGTVNKRPDQLEWIHLPFVRIVEGAKCLSSVETGLSSLY